MSAREIVKALVYREKAIATHNIDMNMEAEWALDRARYLLTKKELRLLLLRTSGMEVKNILKKMRLSPLQFKDMMQTILEKLETEDND